MSNLKEKQLKLLSFDSWLSSFLNKLRIDSLTKDDRAEYTCRALSISGIHSKVCDDVFYLIPTVCMLG